MNWEIIVVAALAWLGGWLIGRQTHRERQEADVFRVLRLLDRYGLEGLVGIINDYYFEVSKESHGRPTFARSRPLRIHREPGVRDRVGQSPATSTSTPAETGKVPVTVKDPGWNPPPAWRDPRDVADGWPGHPFYFRDSPGQSYPVHGPGARQAQHVTFDAVEISEDGVRLLLNGREAMWFYKAVHSILDMGDKLTLKVLKGSVEVDVT